VAEVIDVVEHVVVDGQLRERQLAALAVALQPRVLPRPQELDLRVRRDIDAEREVASTASAVLRSAVATW
jgi:hypothetical protein